MSYSGFMTPNVLIWILKMYICIPATLYLHKCCITSCVHSGLRLQFSHFFTQYLLAHKVLMSLKILFLDIVTDTIGIKLPRNCPEI